MDWTKEAIQAGLDASFEAGRMFTEYELRAALDAAVKAQFQQNTASVAYQMAYQSGRAEALEEVAKAIDAKREEEERKAFYIGSNLMIYQKCAGIARSLKDKQTEREDR